MKYIPGMQQQECHTFELKQVSQQEWLLYIELIFCMQTTIRSAFADCTTLTIAHRLNTIMDSDRILILEAGRLLEFDSPQVLAKVSPSADLALVLSHYPELTWPCLWIRCRHLCPSSPPR